ncbi:MAG: hypothetical protein WBM70_07075, partial [Sulfurovum sp.]|uniref:hypothetical protein n=1 Tax=Sulfurovum sp. TaxID=1969726 RepID=UPI003C719C62
MLRITFIFISSIFLFLPSLLQAKKIKAHYSVEFGIVGEVGKVQATLTSDDQFYAIDANVATVGLGKAVTNNLKERHISKGHVVKGLLVTDMY